MRGPAPCPPGFIALVSVGGLPPAFNAIHAWLLSSYKVLYPIEKEAMPYGFAPRKPATALMSLPSVALSSVAVKQLYYVSFLS